MLPSLSDIDVENHIFDDKICCNPVDNPIVPVGSVSPKPSEVSGQFIEENKSFVSSPSDDFESKFCDADIIINRVRAVTLKVPVVTNGKEVKSVLTQVLR